MGKFSDFKLQLKGMPAGEHTFTYHLGQEFFDNMENTDIHGADLNVELRVKCAAESYDLAFAITGEVVLLCDRCLDELPFPIDAHYHVRVEYGEGYDDAGDDLLIIPYSDAYLNVAYLIYDTVVLAIPIKHVHPMGKCNRQMTEMLRKHRAKGSDEDSELEDTLIDEMEAGCDTDADDAPTDPRWDALRGLASDSDN